MPIPSPLRRLGSWWHGPRAALGWHAAVAAAALALVAVLGLIVHVLTSARHGPESQPAAAGPMAPEPVAVRAVLAATPKPTAVATPAPPAEVMPPPPPAPVAVAPPPAPPELAFPPADAATCKAENYGTSVAFLGSPAAAGREARRGDRLVFLLHISGNFEDSRFT